MKVFTEAKEASAAVNLAKTFGQTIVFWAVFLVLVPWLITVGEDWVGISRVHFTGQRGLGVAIFAVMAVVNLWSGVTMAVVGRGTPFPADTARELVIRGPYRFVRNPMALGGLGLGFAVGVYLGSPITIAYVLAGGLLWNAVARPMEEKDLAKRFGDPYRVYCEAVRCWIPRLRPYG